jgi:hypothetical protein
MIQQNVGHQVVVTWVSGGSITCASHEDAELVRDAERRFFEGTTGRRLPRRTLEALERAGLNPRNSMLYRSVMDKLES